MTVLLALALCALPIDDVRYGDVNDDGAFNISDPIYLSNYLYRGGPEPGCMEQADANGDGVVDGSDISVMTDCLFNGGPCGDLGTCSTNQENLSCDSGGSC